MVFGLSFFCIFLVLMMGTSLPCGASEKIEFAPYVKLKNEGKTEKAVKELLSVSDQRISDESLHLKYFALGIWLSDLRNWAESRARLEKSLQYGKTNAAHIHYLIGHTHKEQGEYKKASESFTRALKSEPAQNIIFQSRFEYSEMAILMGQSSRARDHLRYLERRWRGTPYYPEVLWRLIGVEFKDNRRHLACRWARKIYSRYPSYPKIIDWGVDLQSNKYEGRPTGCLASQKDIRARIRYLQLSGLADKARAEIEVLRGRSRPHEKEAADMLLVSHLENQGYPDEALKILVRYYNSHRRSPNYQNLLGKVASRAGEFQLAIGAYYSAYGLSPRSRHGKNALFTSAFLSYQIQDYDGAYRKFSDLVRKFKGSGLARDAKWHLAWLQYLKTDYSGAERAFRDLLNEKYYVRRRRVVRPFQNDRTRYWLAMSLVKQKKYVEGRKILQKLANDKSLSFYSIVAQNRLAQLPAVQEERTLATSISPSTDEEAQADDIAEVTNPGVLFSPNGEKENVTDETESEETLSSQLEDESGDESAETKSDSSEDGENGPKLEAAQEDDSGASLEPGDIVSVTSFQDPRLRERFQRAHHLMTIGMNEWAKWELFEIERRTNNKTYLKMLMQAYARIGSYNRSSYISEIYFSGERARQGLQAGRELWEYNYPRAYGDVVTQYSKKFGVSEPLVLAIMRAESRFNKEAYSPVGARGLMQIMPYTANHLARLMGEDEISEEALLNPEVSIRLGSRYLSRLQKKFESQIPLVAAGYNAGPHRVNGWLNSFGSLDMDEFIEHVPFVETRNYMKKVVRNYAIYDALYSAKPATNVWLTRPIPVRVSSRPSPRENWEAID